jgi:hypothetical protein
VLENLTGLQLGLAHHPGPIRFEGTEIETDRLEENGHERLQLIVGTLVVETALPVADPEHHLEENAHL